MQLSIINNSNCGPVLQCLEVQRRMSIIVLFLHPVPIIPPAVVIPQGNVHGL